MSNVYDKKYFNEHNMDERKKKNVNIRYETYLERKYVLRLTDIIEFHKILNNKLIFMN